MRLLIDTHILIWQFIDDPRMTQKFRTIVDDPSNEKVVSDASFWEMAIKVSQGRLKLKISDVEREIAENGYERLPIKADHIRVIETLPRHHRDPFDHLLIAQAMVERIPVLTADEQFGAYPIQLALA